MFMCYPIENWLGVVEWFGLMIVLGVFVFCLSAYLSNKYINKKDKLYKVKLYKVKNKKKQWFYDVA